MAFGAIGTMNITVLFCNYTPSGMLFLILCLRHRQRLFASRKIALNISFCLPGEGWIRRNMSQTITLYVVPFRELFRHDNIFISFLHAFQYTTCEEFPYVVPFRELFRHDNIIFLILHVCGVWREVHLTAEFPGNTCCMKKFL